MKKYFRQKLGPLVWRRMAQAKFEFKVRKLTDFSTAEIGEHLRRLLQIQNGFYVEVGANDGRSSSNTLWLEKEMNWNGLLVEPVLHKYFENINRKRGIYPLNCSIGLVNLLILF